MRKLSGGRYVMRHLKKEPNTYLYDKNSTSINRKKCKKKQMCVTVGCKNNI